MKTYITLFAVLCMSFTAIAQEKKDAQLEEQGDLTKVTLYHDNGNIEQTGFFNAEGKPQGTWKQYNLDGKKISVGNYEDGKKIGKWFFWTGDTLKEVDYVDSRIASVNEWTGSKALAVATRNK